MNYFKKFAVAAAASAPLIAAQAAPALADQFFESCMENMRAPTTQADPFGNPDTRGKVAARIVMDHYAAKRRDSAADHRFYKSLYDFANPEATNKIYVNDVASALCAAGFDVEGKAFKTRNGSLTVSFPPNFEVAYARATNALQTQQAAPQVIVVPPPRQPRVVIVPGGYDDGYYYDDNDWHYSNRLRRAWDRQHRLERRQHRQRIETYRLQQQFNAQRRHYLNQQQRQVRRNMREVERFQQRAYRNPRILHRDGPVQGWQKRSGGSKAHKPRKHRR